MILGSFCLFCLLRLLLRCNQQGRKVKDLRSKCNTRMQRARSTGINHHTPALNGSKNVGILLYFSIPVVTQKKRARKMFLLKKTLVMVK